MESELSCSLNSSSLMTAAVLPKGKIVSNMFYRHGLWSCFFCIGEKSFLVAEFCSSHECRGLKAGSQLVLGIRLKNECFLS